MCCVGDIENKISAYMSGAVDVTCHVITSHHVTMSPCHDGVFVFISSPGCVVSVISPARPSPRKRNISGRQLSGGEESGRCRHKMLKVLKDKRGLE